MKTRELGKAFACIAVLVTAACSGGGSGSGSSSGASESTSGSSASSSGGGGTTTVSCDVAEAGSHLCFQWNNLSAADAAQRASSCMKTTTGVIGTGCAKTNLVGTCTTPTQTTYYDCGPAAGYETDCAQSHGTWTGGGGGEATCN